MESNTQSPPNDNNVDGKATATFRKPVIDAGSRKYRRRSAVDGSSSSEGSPIGKRTSSPPATRNDREKFTDEPRRMDGGRDLDRDSGRGQYGRGGDSTRYSETHASRSSRDYHRRNDYRGKDKYANVADRDYSRPSRYSEFYRKENEYRPRQYDRDSGKFLRDKSDRYRDRSRDSEKESLSREFRKPEEKDLSSNKAGQGHRSSASEDDFEEGEMYEDKRDIEERISQERSSRNYKPDHSPSYEHSKTYKIESISIRDRYGYRHKEANRNDGKLQDDEGYTKLEKKSSDQKDKFNDRYDRKSEVQFDDGKKYYSKDQDTSTKKPKLSGSNGSTEDGEDVTKVKAAQEPSDKGSSEQAGVTNSDIVAAKLAALKTAESVNRNLIGTGYMSADQKKKLLWGNKKTAATEESVNRWDTTTFGDSERQEKFHKLMSLRLHWYLLPIVGCEGRHESGNEKARRPTRCREAEGATPTGFREAIHCWTSSQRRSHCWTRPLNFLFKCLCESHFIRETVVLHHFVANWFEARLFLANLAVYGCLVTICGYRIETNVFNVNFSELIILQPSLSYPENSVI